MPGNPLGFTLDAMRSDNQAAENVRKALEELNSLQVYVGVPKESNASHAGSDGKAPVTPINNAHLMYIHSYGSPVRGIPSREILEPAMRFHKAELVKMIQEATQEALRGDIASVRPSLEKMGAYGTNISRDWFTNSANGWKALKLETINRKGSARPLIDTGQLRKSITHVVDKKGARKTG